MKRYCQNCKIALREKALGLFTQDEIWEFEDGFYCDKCAKVKMEKARK